MYIPYDNSSRVVKPKGAATWAVLGSVLTLAGTGSAYDISRATDWRTLVQHRVPLIIDVEAPSGSPAPRPDVRTAAEHIANIRQVLNPAIADLASVLGVSRQAIYKWIGGDVSPERDKLERICTLSHVADAFRGAGVSRASALLKVKAFDGRSLMDLVAGGEFLPKHVQALIAEARVMEAAYDRSGLARAKAKPTQDWQTELSVPGYPE
ncbi:MAG: helix-turn-helix domain-containing protein [Immundisolibacter sp.]|uniref:helix-turn-helix domain-containing protein n=1 Tax=Immundisolibacter sp. TaxID=1934948 RepID=UPI003EE146DC